MATKKHRDLFGRMSLEPDDYPPTPDQRASVDSALRMAVRETLADLGFGADCDESEAS